MRGEFERLIKRANRLSAPKRRLLLTAYISEQFGRRFVVVGGSADEFYTRGKYTTGDVDVAAIANEAVRELEAFLRELGFEVDEQGIWYHSDTDYALEIFLGGGGLQTKTVEVGDYAVLFESPEEAVVHDLANYKFWRERIYRDRAVLVFRSTRDRFDVPLARELAREHGVSELLEEILGRGKRRRTSAKT